MTTKPNSGTVSVSRKLIVRLCNFHATGWEDIGPEIQELRATLAEQHIVCSNGILCQSTACEECGGNGSYKSETRDQSVNQYPEGKRERFQKWVLSIEHPVKGWLDGHWLKRGDDGEGYADEYVQGLWVAFKALEAQQGEPVAVMYEDGSVLTKADCIDDEVFAICCKVQKPLYLGPQPATAKVGGEVLEKLKELVSAVRSINRSPKHEIRVIGDDQPCYAQRKEWVEWLLSICDDADEVAKLNGATKVVLPDCMNFTYEHRDNKERHTVSVSRAEIIKHMDEQLFVKLTDKFCQCEFVSIGKTNVVECRCNEYTEEFELVPDAGAASTTVAELQARLDLVQAENAARMRQAEIVNDKYWSALKGSEAIAKELDQLKARGDELASVVKLAREFVKNGIELGYITMPDDDTPDPAHDLLPRMDAVLGNNQT